jgi:hypothetical protein
MFSKEYYDSVAKCADFHKKNKTWSGKATFQYADEIKKLVIKHTATNLLDYGCGKGLHYDPASHVKMEGKTFDNWLGINSFYLYDPCVEGLDVLPAAGSKFDAVIAIQCLTAVPDKDFDAVVNYLMSVTNKFCFVGNSNLAAPVKSKKSVADPEFFTETRDNEWWQNKFKNWQNSELVLYFLPN